MTPRIAARVAAIGFAMSYLGWVLALFSMASMPGSVIAELIVPIVPTAAVSILLVVRWRHAMALATTLCCVLTLFLLPVAFELYRASIEEVLVAAIPLGGSALVIGSTVLSRVAPKRGFGWGLGRHR